MKMSALIAASLLAGFSSIAHADQKSASMELVEAYRVIEAYQELRDSCAEGNYDERRACVSKLSQASAEYRAAKDAIAEARLTTAANGSFAIYN